MTEKPSKGAEASALPQLQNEKEIDSRQSSSEKAADLGISASTNERLRALSATWREHAIRVREDHKRYDSYGDEAGCLEQCADDLDAVVGAHLSPPPQDLDLPWRIITNYPMFVGQGVAIQTANEAAHQEKHPDEIFGLYIGRAHEKALIARWTAVVELVNRVGGEASARPSPPQQDEIQRLRAALRAIVEVQYNRLDAEEGALTEHAEIAAKALLPLPSPDLPPQRELIALDALRSIAANSCCDRCQEAALVARKALRDIAERE